MHKEQHLGYGFWAFGFKAAYPEMKPLFAIRRPIGHQPGRIFSRLYGLGLGFRV